MTLHPLHSRYKNKQSYLSWLASYAVFIALFLASITLIAVWAKSILKTEIINANKASFNTIQSNIDSIKTDLDKLAVTVASNESILHFSENQGENTHEDYYDISLIQDDLQTYWKTYDYIEEISILNGNTQQILINGGLMHAKDAYLSYAFRDENGNLQSYEAWLDFIKSSHKQEMYQTDNGLIIYIQSLPYSIYDDPVGTLIFVIDKWKFSNLIHQDNFKDGKSFLLLNHRSDVIFSLGTDYFSKDKSFEAFHHLLSDNKLPNTEIIRSDRQGKLQCIMLISDRIFWMPLNKMYLVILISALVLILIGIFLALKFTNKHYSPVKSLVQFISQQKQASSAGLNEYDLIKNYVSDTLVSLKKSHQIQQQYKNETLNSEFIKFLDHTPSSDSLSKLFQRFQVAFAHESYVSAMISVTDLSDYFSDVDIDLQQEQNLIKLAVTNILNELIGPQYDTLSFTINSNMIFCLIGTNNASWDPAFKMHILTAQNLTKSKAGIDYTMAVSKCYDSLDDVFTSYLQTIDVQAYGKNTSADVLFYDEINWNSQNYEFTLDLERQLIELIHSGNETKIRPLVGQLCSISSPQTDIVQKVTWLKYDLIGVCLKFLRQQKVQISPEITNLLSNINRCQTLEAFKPHILKLFHLLCTQYASQEPLSSEQPLAEQIMNDVKLHYADPDLNVNMLGLKYDLTPGYLSKLFKEYTGQMLRSYIMDTRLKNAQLLLASELKLEKIAEKCGFADSGSFIRAFKKHLGITPGKYRETIQNPSKEN